MLNRIANIFVVLTCLAAMIIMAARWAPAFISHRPPQFEYKVGQVYSKAGTLPTNQKTLVMGLWAHCSVCKRELPTYQRLARAKHIADGTIGVVAVFPPPNMQNSAKASDVERESKELLKPTGMPAIINIPGSFPFTATPTLLLLDRNRQIIWASRGLLTPSQEKELFELLS
jgi:hypothetical protein